MGLPHWPIPNCPTYTQYPPPLFLFLCGLIPFMACGTGAPLLIFLHQDMSLPMSTHTNLWIELPGTVNLHHYSGPLHSNAPLYPLPIAQSPFSSCSLPPLPLHGFDQPMCSPPLRTLPGTDLTMLAIGSP